jgi:hypothetical protein
MGDMPRPSDPWLSTYFQTGIGVVLANSGLHVHRTAESRPEKATVPNINHALRP